MDTDTVDEGLEQETDPEEPVDSADPDPEDEADGEGSETDGEPAEAEAAAEADEVVVTIGDDAEPAERAPEWVRDLRKKAREQDRVIRELRQKLEAPAAAAEIGPEPTMESCDFDEDTFKTRWREWNRKKAEADTAEARRSDEARKQQEAWQKKLDAYAAKKAALKVPDFDDAEEVVKDVLSVVQQGIILSGAESPEMLMYALGKSPKRAQELAAIADPVRFAFAVAKMEAQLKVTTKKSVPLPERKLTSKGAPAANLESKRAVDQRLEAARRSGDYTGYLEAKRARKQA